MDRLQKIQDGACSLCADEGFSDAYCPVCGEAASPNLPKILRHRINPDDYSLELVDYEMQDERLALTVSAEFGNEVAHRWNLHVQLVNALADVMKQVDDQQAMSDNSHHERYDSLLAQARRDYRKQP